MKVYEPESGEYRETTPDKVVPRNHSVMFDTERNRERYDSVGLIHTNYGGMMIVTAFEKRKKDHEQILRIIGRARESEGLPTDWTPEMKKWVRYIKARSRWTSWDRA